MHAQIRWTTNRGPVRPLNQLRERTRSVRAAPPSRVSQPQL